MGENPTKNYTILYIITQSSWGGAQQYVFDLAVAMSMRGNKVIVAAGGSPNGRLMTLLHEHNIATRYIPSLVRNLSPFKNIASVWALYRLCRKIKPDIVHGNSSMAGAVGSLAARLAGTKKIIYTAHGFVTKEPLAPLALALYGMVEKIGGLLRTRTICVSRDDQEHGIGKKFIIKDNSSVIPVALAHTPQFIEREEARVELNEKFPSLNRAKQWVMNIAYFYPTKGLEYLIKACALLKKEGREVQLILIGDGEEKNRLQSLARDYNIADDCVFTGAIDDAARYLKAADMFILPSLKEGYPYTLLEAKQARVPIIASHVGGIPEALEDYPAATLVPPADEYAIKAAIEKVLQEMRTDTYTPASGNEDFTIMIEKTKRIYDH